MGRLLLVALLCVAQPAFANDPFKRSGTNVDVRTVLAFKASDAAVRRLLPEDWEVNPPAAGPAKGSNVSVVLIDQVVAHDAGGKLVEPVRAAVLSVPARKTGSDVAGVMIPGGLATPTGAPGAYGVYAPAKASVERGATVEAGGVRIAETWSFEGGDGASVKVQIRYGRGAPTPAKAEQRVYAAAKPDFYRLYRVEQATDVARSAATGTDRVSALSFTASGAPFASLFDGSEQLISVTSIPWYSREVLLPGS